MSYKIFTDCTADLTKEIIKEFDLTLIPLSYVSNGENFEFLAGSEEDAKKFYDFLRAKQNLSTSCANVQTFIEYFEKELINGNDVLYIGFSSGLSQTYNNAVLAKEELLKKYPERKIICVDSLLASLGQGLMVYSIALYKQSGASIEECLERVINTRQSVNSIFTVKTLANLVRGGRISKLTYALGTAIDIKPTMYVSENGKLLSYGKVLGRKRSIFSIADKVAKTILNAQEQYVFIAHGDCLEEAEFLAKLIESKVKVKGFIYNYIDPVIAVHSGPDTLAVFYYGVNREEAVKQAANIAYDGMQKI
ncbi:MAG: DegV family protein [Clostridia bacterium]|nr:DegV family protein [Clostridia bacterium]